MQSRFKSGKIEIRISKYPVPMVNFFHNNQFWFATDNPKSLLDVSKVIAEFAKALNQEEKKMWEDTAKQVNKIQKKNEKNNSD